MLFLFGGGGIAGKLFIAAMSQSLEINKNTASRFPSVRMTQTQLTAVSVIPF